MAGILDAVVSALTPDRYESKYQHAPVVPPRQSLTQYLSGTAKSFDPRTPGGAFNLATLLVPGAGRGKPTFEQQALLDAIGFSSKRQIPGIRAGFRPSDPSVMKLADKIGQPVSFEYGFGSPNYYGHAAQHVARDAGEILSPEKIFYPESGFRANPEIRQMIIDILKGNQGG